MIVGTMEGYITTAGQIAHQRGAKVAHVETIDQALSALRSGNGADLLMVDEKLDIATLVRQLKTERITIEVVACGLGDNARSAVEAIRSGAKEYVPLPPDADLIAAILEAVTQEDHQLVSRDPAMGQVIRLADQVAPSDASILITGESGTGKEVMSRYVHIKSRRKDKPFISVNCAAIPDNLLESELFGHEKGAFTGAVSRRIGKFEEANGGTLLLDEVTEMDPKLQAKLLRAIQERVIDRVGGKEPVKVDIRIIATSNRDLLEAVREGQFREDLYFRLNVINLMLPPLRQRPMDVAVLANHFAKKYAELNQVEDRPLSENCLIALQQHQWPGNVRELENTMHRAVLLATSTEIEPENLLLAPMPQQPQAGATAPSPIPPTHPAPTEPATPAPTTPTTAEPFVPMSPAGFTPAQPDTFVPATVEPPAYLEEDTSTASQTSPAETVAFDFDAPVKTAEEEAAQLVGRTVADVEKELILNTLTHCLGNRTHAANILGISIRTLRNKLKLYSEEGVAIPMPGDGNNSSVTA